MKVVVAWIAAQSDAAAAVHGVPKAAQPGAVVAVLQRAAAGPVCAVALRLARAAFGRLAVSAVAAAPDAEAVPEAARVSLPVRERVSEPVW